MKGWMQVLRGVLLGDTPVRKWGSRSGQREKLIHNVVATEGSADPRGSSGAEKVPQSCPKLRLCNQSFASLSCEPPTGSVTLGAIFPCGPGQCANEGCSFELSAAHVPTSGVMGILAPRDWAEHHIFCNHICELLELSFFLHLSFVSCSLMQGRKVQKWKSGERDSSKTLTVWP